MIFIKIKTNDLITKELVEKWKLTYDLNLNNSEKNKSQNIQNFKNKINIYIKSII